MKSKIKKIIPDNIKSKLNILRKKYNLVKLQSNDSKRYRVHSSSFKKNCSQRQLSALLTRNYHSIEKGLSHNHIRLGFGKEQINKLLHLLELYTQKGYSKDDIAYVSAVDNLVKYVEHHERFNYDVSYIKYELNRYSDLSNEDIGGTYEFVKSDILSKSTNFVDFSKSRHSVRTFSKETVDKELINKAIKLAQNAPSSCNRQPWHTRVVRSEKLKKILRNNQYGNRGFGENVDTFIIITSNVEVYGGSDTERNQSYIDGGIYAMNLLYSLHYYELATCSLSTALTSSQEDNIRKTFNIADSENLILIIAVGNYTDKFKVPKSTRYNPKVDYY